MSQDIRLMTQQELLNVLAVLSRANAIYTQAVVAKQRTQQAWQQRMIGRANARYNWRLPVVSLLPAVGLLMVNLGTLGDQYSLLALALQSYVVAVVLVGIVAYWTHTRRWYQKAYLQRRASLDTVFQAQLDRQDQAIYQDNYGLVELAQTVNYPRHYLYNGYPTRIYDIVAVGRATNFQEALNILENDLYHERVERQNQAIYRSTHQAEINARAARNWAMAATFFAEQANYKAGQH